MRMIIALGEKGKKMLKKMLKEGERWRNEIHNRLCPWDILRDIRYSDIECRKEQLDEGNQTKGGL